MKFIGINMRRAGMGMACVLGGVTAALIAGPTAVAAEQCSAASVSGTVSSVTGQAQQYLGAHPGANRVVTAAYSQPRDRAAADIRGYFTANPQEYFELRGILAPIGDVQRQCNMSVLPPELASAFNEFMAG